MRLGWLVQSGGYDLASNRYRCFHIAYGLGERGHESRIFDAPAEPDIASLDVLVIIKRLDHVALSAAVLARKHGVPVVYDICDDVTSRGYRADGTELNRLHLAGLGAMVDTVTTTGPELAERLRPLLPADTPIVLIPDVSETPELLAASRQLWRGGDAVRAVREPSRKLSARLFRAATHPGRTVRALWTGGRQTGGRLLYAITHPDWTIRRAVRSVRGLRTLALARFSGRVLHVIRNPDWLFRRIAASAPGRFLRRVGFVLRHPRASLRSIARKLGRALKPSKPHQRKERADLPV